MRPIKIGVAIGTFGDIDVWKPLARRALASAKTQSVKADAVTWVHSDTLREARNLACDDLYPECDYVIFLDADDELDPGYIEAMHEAFSKSMVRSDARHFIFRPATLGVYEDGTEDAEAVMIPERDLRTANYIVIGAMCNVNLWDAVDGFDDYPMLEDWALWRKMVKAGAAVVDVPDAIYRVHVRPESRNTDTQLHRQVYRQIMKDIPL